MPNMGERKHINSVKVNKQSKDGEEYSKDVMTKNYTTHEHKN
jgi:hypothetical protein